MIVALCEDDGERKKGEEGGGGGGGGGGEGTHTPLPIYLTAQQESERLADSEQNLHD